MAKMSIKIASKGLSQFDLSQNHLTTTDFGQLQVSSFLPVMPNDKIHCSVGSEARFAPLVVPTFMDCELVTRAFYVPMSAIYQPFEYFYTDRQDASVLKYIPYVKNTDIISFLLNPNYDYVRQVDDGMKPDFSYNSSYYIFTERGRLAMKLFQSLGYSINFATIDETEFSLLPILAFMRICYDYVYPAQYLDGLGITKYFKCSSSSDFQSLWYDLGAMDTFLSRCVALLHLPYRQDYFTAAWRNLNAPGTSVQNVSSLSPDGNNTITSSQDNVNVGTSNTAFSQYGLNLLQRMYDFVTRNNIVGVRYADQIFARFGIGSRRSDPDMSQRLGEFRQKINVVDVTAMSAAEGQDLGDLAGKAYLQGANSLYDFESVDEFGYIVCLSFVMPKQGYYQGRKRWTTCFDRFDFPTPEFDMQMRAIRNDEVFADFHSDAEFGDGLNYGGSPTLKFGHAPNYSEWKKGEDFMTGDFRVPSLNTGLESYYLLRDIVTPSSDHPLSLNADFLFMQQHEYDKIFAQMYTLRAPVGLVEYADTFDVLTYMSKYCFFFVKGNDATKGFFYCVITKDGDFLLNALSSAEINTKFGIDVSKRSTFFAPQMSSDSTGNIYIIAGVQYYIYDLDASSYVTTSTTYNSSHTYVLRLVSDSPTTIDKYEEFLSLYRDYIDHIYLKHHFNIQASRSLVPISEEFMISDGGRVASVDMNGNRIV